MLLSSKALAFYDVATNILCIYKYISYYYYTVLYYTIIILYYTIVILYYCYTVIGFNLFADLSLYCWKLRFWRGDPRGYSGLVSPSHLRGEGVQQVEEPQQLLQHLVLLPPYLLLGPL